VIDLSRDDLDEALELLHFAFRAVVAGPDRELAKLGLGRVHHRVLYFIGRAPDLRVGDLLRVLDVTKQALNAPLRKLERLGLVRRRSDPANRRVKRLALTRKGAALEARLSGAQRRDFARAFRKAGPTARRGWREVMTVLGASGLETLRRVLALE
jgi:DNA-binding MarR family transcriptional regulator